MIRAFLALLSSALLLTAQSATGKTSAARRMKEDVTALSTPAMEGRGDGSQGLDRAADLVQRRYKAMGLKTEKQTLPFPTGVEVVTGKAFLGKGDGQLPPLTWGKDIQATSFSGNGVFNSKALAFAGYGMQVGTYNDFNGVDLTSKVLIIARELPDIPAFASLSMEERSLRGRLRRFETARLGALILLEEGDSPRPLTLNPGIPSFHYPVVSMTAKALEPVCGDLAARLKKIRETGQPQSIDFVWAPWSYMGLTLELERKEKQLPNILATIPGSDPKLRDEIIVLGAHLDHLGRGERHSLGGGAFKGTFHPGADDNASGTALLLELARQLKSMKPRRTILLAHFSGEEEGLLGSAAWVKAPTVPISMVKAMLNFDMVGRMDPKKPMLLLGGLGAKKTALERAKSLAPDGLEIGGDLGVAAGSSDHLSFALAGIPTYFFFTGLHADYHKPTDTADKINGPGMAMVAKYAKAVTLDLANTDQVPAFDPETAKLPAGHGGPGAKVKFGTIPDYAEHSDGFHINGVGAGSPAEILGLKGGDVIIEFAGKPLKTIYDFMDAIAPVTPGSTVKVKWLRGGSAMEGDALFPVRQSNP